MATVSDLIDKIDDIKNDNNGNDGLNRTRSAFACMTVGAIVGLMVGYSKKWNLFYSIIGGGAVGSIAGAMFTKKS